jgi:hypothetical protein
VAVAARMQLKNSISINNLPPTSTIPHHKQQKGKRKEKKRKGIFFFFIYIVKFLEYSFYVAVAMLLPNNK